MEMNTTKGKIYTIFVLCTSECEVAEELQRALPTLSVAQISGLEQINQTPNLLIILEETSYEKYVSILMDCTVWSHFQYIDPQYIDELLPSHIDAEFLIARIEHHIHFKTAENQSDKALMQLANAINNSVMVCDKNGDLQWTNKAFEKTYGYSRKEFIARNGLNIKDFGSQDLTLVNLETMLQNKSSMSYVTTICSAEGASKSLQTTLSPVYESGRLKWIVAIEADISHLKDSGKVLKMQSESLKNLAEELKEANHEMQTQRDELDKKHQELMLEKERTDELLHNILPEVVAHQLKKGKKKTKRHKSVTVMFADFKGFTKICKYLDPEEIVSTLDELFSEFDKIVEKHFIEKIKTIGDAYMCAGGMPMKNNSHAVNIVMAALEIQHFLFEYNKPRMLKKETVWECRVGIHTGEVFAGVVGQKKFAYDIWGDTVNVAARMETGGAVNSVNISETTYELVKDYFVCISRGDIDAKNIGSVSMYFVEGLRPEYAADNVGVFPNAEFEKILRSL